MLSGLVQRQCSRDCGDNKAAAQAAKATVITIPVVFEACGDPVQLGLVRSLITRVETSRVSQSKGQSVPLPLPGRADGDIEQIGFLFAFGPASVE